MIQIFSYLINSKQNKTIIHWGGVWVGVIASGYLIFPFAETFHNTQSAKIDRFLNTK